MNDTKSVPGPEVNDRLTVSGSRQVILDGKHEIWNDVVDQLNGGKTQNLNLNIVAAFLVVAFNHDYTHWGFSQVPLTKDNPLQTIANVYQEETTLDSYKPNGMPTFRKREPFGGAPQLTVLPLAAVFIGTNSDGLWGDAVVGDLWGYVYVAGQGGPSMVKGELQKIVRKFAFDATENFLKTGNYAGTLPGLSEPSGSKN